MPAILVTRKLARQLAELEAQGAIHGEIVLVPFANPIGMAQHVLGAHARAGSMCVMAAISTGDMLNWRRW